VGEKSELYSNPQSFVNFLLPPLTKGRVGVGEKIYDSCKDCYIDQTNIVTPQTVRKFLIAET
jgi:hypothetical protein